jgi:putative transposase
MRGWFTLPDLLALHLPGLPDGRMSLYRMVVAEGWATKTTHDGEALSRKRAGRDGGGGMEYHISLLPSAARTELSAQATKIESFELAKSPRLIEPLMAAPDCTADALRIDSRMAVLSMADAFFAGNFAMGRKAADADFCERYNARDVAVDQWVADEVATVSVRSLFRWRQDRDTGRWHAIGGKGRRDKSLLERVEDGDVAGYIGGCLAREPHLKASHLRDLVEARFSAELRLGLGVVPIPVERSFQRFIAMWKEQNATALMKLNDPDAFKSRFRFSGNNAYSHVVRLNQLWEIDASPADMLCTDGRYAIYVLIDIYSRRIISHVTKNPRTEASLYLLRKAIIEWGVPESLRTDNGSDFTSHAFKRALRSVGVIHDITRAFSPEQKGIVERAIGTMQRSLMTTLDGFIGHSVADRKVIEARKSFAARLGVNFEKADCVNMTSAELQGYMDAWCKNQYAHRTHATLKTSPFLKAQTEILPDKNISNPRVLDMLLSAADGGARVVTKRGIRINGAYYFAGALIAGMKVFCRQDPLDMGHIKVFKDDELGEFICEAVCPELAGIDVGQAVAMVRAEQNRIHTEAAKDVRAQQRAIKPRHMADAIRDLHIQKSANITAFPRRSETYSTEAIEQAEIALDGVFAAPEFAAPANDQAASNVVQLAESPKQRFARALVIKAAMERGENILVEDARWFGGYEQMPEYKSQVGMFADFGSEWLNA